MARKFATVLTLLVCLSSLVSAQGLVANASKDDWEEINFEFNSSVLAGARTGMSVDRTDREEC